MFASPERSSDSDLERHGEFFSETFIARHLLDAVPDLLAIVNQYRQIVYANESLLALTGYKHLDDLKGRRPGDALNCIHSEKTEGGCGNGEHCRTCGTLLALLAGLSGRREERECRVTRLHQGRRESLDLKVRAVPLEFGRDRFTLFSLSDISDRKRRVALERIFFHDVLNVVGSIKGFSEFYREMDQSDPREIVDLIHRAAGQAIDEIQAQRTLLAAEDGDMQVTLEPVRSIEILNHLVAIYRHHEVAKGRTLRLDETSDDAVLNTDRILLGRILGNMMKNALEATASGGTVTVGCRRGGRRLEFWVHNAGVIPREVQMQIFQRSFSTKGPGRGLGTYGMALLSDYLEGEIAFSSDEEKGTVFKAFFPLGLS